MGKGERLWERLADGIALSEEVMPGKPLVEICGNDRVLIENHRGVKGYGQERIIVAVTYGEIHICGRCLQLHRMSRERLVIRGRIDHVALHRRC